MTHIRKLFLKNQFLIKNDKKIDEANRKMESDIPGIDFYDKTKNKVKDECSKIVSSLPEEIFDKNGKKLNGTFRKKKPIEIDEKGKGVMENIEMLKMMF